MPGSRTQKQASSHPSRPESSRTSLPCALRSRSLGQTAKSKRRLRNSNSSNDKCMGVQNLTFSKHDCSAQRDPRCVIKYASDPIFRAEIQSAPTGSIDRTATIHRCAGPDCGSRDRPRPQHDAGPYDATGRIFNILAVDHGTGLFSARSNEPSYQQGS